MKNQKRILILGVTGMLGHKLYLSWKNTFDVYGTVRKPIEKEFSYLFDGNQIMENVSTDNIQSVDDAISQTKPDYVINCIGIVKQLDASKDAIPSIQVNSLFPHLLAKACQKHKVQLIHMSTDCVFSGSEGMYTEEDTPDARDLYGLSKLMGEVTGEGCLTIRTSIIGRELGTNHGLLEWFLSQNHNSVKGFTKALFTGFPTNYLAEILKKVITEHDSLSGLYHVAANPINKYELLKLIKETYNLDIEIMQDNEYSCDRRLDSSKFNSLTGFAPPVWSSLITRMYEEDKEYYK